MSTVRRALILLLVLGSAVAGGGLLAPASAQVRPDDPRAGLVYAGLRQAAAGSFCAGAFESVLAERVPAGLKNVLCTHGPDAAPDGVDVRVNREPDLTAEVPLPSGATAAAETPPLGCYGTGSDGYRVQLIYARSASGSDRYSAYAASFKAWAARLDDVVNQSAGQTGGTRHVRFVTDSSCNPIVQRVTLSDSAMSNFGSMVTALHNGGYARTDRKYLVWADANVYCGIAEIYNDDSADATPGRNYNNGNRAIQGSVARVDNGCWGQPNMVEAHELLHNLGGVQLTAPNATGGYHCNDESDRLCYADGTRSSTMRQVCPLDHEALYDCNNDDYFSTAPDPGSYLGTHWNSANSAFLTSLAPTVPGTTTTTAPPSTTTTTTAPPPTTTSTSTTTTTTIAPPPSTTTTVPPGTTTTLPPSGTVPSAPQGLSATQPQVGGGVQLVWQAPATGPVTGYRIYRGTSPSSQTLLATVGNVLGYADTSAGRLLYYYRVTAYNAAGEGPASNLTGMIGKVATSAGMVSEDVDRRLVVSSTVGSSPLVARRWA